MRSLMQGFVCVSLVLGLSVQGETLGVNECSKVYHYLRTLSITKYHTESYSLKCGWWQRCTRTRLASYPQYYTEWTPEERTECCDGWRRDRFGQCAMVICDPPCINGDCVAPDTCQCQPGYTGITCNTDIDECDLQISIGVFNSVLKCDHMCINSIGSYRCECELGYTLNTDRHTCKDTDECLVSRTHNCQQNCTNVPGGFECNCHGGYTINGDGATCDGVGECSQDMACDHFCIITNGSFECACEMGYRNDSNNCYDIDECSLGEHDCSQICINGNGTFTCDCYEGYELGMNNKTCFDIDECAPSSMNCDKIRICNVTDEHSVCSYFKGHIINTTTVELNIGTKDDVGVRLGGGRYPSEGRVEVFYGGQWTTVCGSSWDLNDAHVVCKQLNYTKAASFVTSSASFGQGIGPMHLHNVQCVGTERDIRDCPNRCGQAAWVNCTSEIRLVGSPPSYGRLELFFNGEWGTVCDDGWDGNDATVVCRQLNFPSLYTYWGSATPFGPGSGPIHMTYLSCGGSETRLKYCQHRHAGSTCSHGEDVAVKCNAGTTDIRLVGGTSSSGTVEVLYGGAWRTVCGNGWDINDAHAACRQLHFERAESILSNGTFRYGSEPGSYELSDFRCGGSNKRLLDCSRTTNTVCQHSQDAGVICEIDKPPSFNCTALQVCSQTGRKLICACVEDEEHELTNMTGSTEGPCRNDDPTNPTKIHLCRNRTGEFSCGCVEGFQLNIENIFCQSETTHDCNTMQSCRNTKGGYDCPCIEGYTRNDETGECDDIDECSTDYMNCPEAQICNTFNKTIFCECLEGNATDCDLDNCINTCAGVEVCTNGACSCYQGYFLNTENMPCEGGGCGEMIHECTDMETCNNTIGGYECPCMNGFLRGQGVNATCDDIDECMEETDGCDHLCMNTVGGYSCACVAGFTLLEDRHTCVMPMSLQEAYMAVKEGGTTKRSSIGGWFFPLGMIVACALVAAVVIGRKKSERFRDGTDRMMSAAESLRERIAGSAARSGAQSDRSSGRHGSQLSPVKPRSDTADGMGDTSI
ncbi:uncharacterized protein [Asterias amurensis]|uniref:uncharacterized protein n=1 Tax=Asterias amurensis TaxID=7602 RepID=UPI003AB16FA8